MADTNEISIAGSVADAIVIAGNGNHVTVYLAAGVSRAPDPLVSSGVANAVFVPNPYRGLAAFFEEDADKFLVEGEKFPGYGRPLERCSKLRREVAHKAITDLGTIW